MTQLPHVAAAETQIHCRIRPSSSLRKAFDSSVRSGASHMSSAGSHASLPKRNRLATTLVSRPASSTHEYHAASRSPFGHSTTAGTWLCCDHSGPMLPEGMRTVGRGGANQGSAGVGSAGRGAADTSR